MLKADDDIFEIKAADQRILDLFHGNDGTLSGEEISAELGISRTAVWKHITSLRALGYSIEAVPSKGYRLAGRPDLFVPADITSGLATKRLGTQVISFRETDSTNSVAFRLADDGAPEGTVVVADRQRQGKGRLGRKWESPGGVNLYASLVLRPKIAPVQACQLTFVSAVAVARAITGIAGIDAAIKWPNDILLNGKKVSGLLNEMSAESDEINFVILGIGVNINMAGEQFPDDLRYPATSIAIEKGQRVDRQEFLRRLLIELDDAYGLYLQAGFAPIRDAWQERAVTTGRDVRVTDHQRTVSGRAGGIDDFGALLLHVPDGTVEKIYAGDVSFQAKD